MTEPNRPRYEHTDTDSHWQKQADTKDKTDTYIHRQTHPPQHAVEQSLVISSMRQSFPNAARKPRERNTTPSGY
jgi:hypothetical protein